jgi:hypothetical protein
MALSFAIPALRTIRREITALGTISRLLRGGRAIPVLLALGLGACAGAGEKNVVETTAIVSAPAKDVATVDFAKKEFTPADPGPVGTSTLEVYERGHERDQNYVRYLASIGQTARESSLAGDTLTIKVGVAGRVVAGPKGSAGNITLPVRIAVAKQFGGTGPLYSQLFKIQVTLAAPTFGELQSGLTDRHQAPQDNRSSSWASTRGRASRRATVAAEPARVPRASSVPAA